MGARRCWFGICTRKRPRRIEGIGSVLLRENLRSTHLGLVARFKLSMQMILNQLQRWWHKCVNLFMSNARRVLLGFPLRDGKAGRDTCLSTSAWSWVLGMLVLLLLHASG